MEEPSVVHSTFVIERSYAVKPERVFAALADPNKKRRWFVEGGGNDVEHFEMDFRVGGTERARFISHGAPVKGISFTNNASYQDIVPNQRVVLASTMSMGDKRISASLATFELLPSETGTDLIFTHQGAFFEGADGPEIREMGWQKLLERLEEELARH
jgi:uncharacterized protein YndB with AHSA1/START domain